MMNFFQVPESGRIFLSVGFHATDVSPPFVLIPYCRECDGHFWDLPECLAPSALLRVI